jgi:hypothetical protein
MNILTQFVANAKLRKQREDERKQMDAVLKDILVMMKTVHDLPHGDPLREQLIPLIHALAADPMILTG